MYYRQILTFILLTNYGCVCLFNVTLDADKSTLLEYENVSLTCSRRFSNGIPFASFENSTDNFISSITVSFTGSVCQSETGRSPWPIYSVQCHNDSTFTLALINVTNELHGKNWRCFQRDDRGFYHYSNLMYLIVHVPVRSAKISLLPGNWTNQQSYIQGETVSIKCETSLGRPQPNVTWFLGESYQNANEIDSSQYRYFNQSETLNYTISIITVNVSRAFHQRKIFCNSTNLPEFEPVSSDFTLLNVEYPPNIQQILNESTLEGQNLSKTCPVDYGNPAETTTSWINAEDVVLSTTDHLILLNVSRSKATYYRCLANNTMIYSNGTSVYGKSSKTFYLNVLYRPERFTVTISMDLGMPFITTQTFSIIENAYLVFNCSATGNPQPSFFSWTGLLANYSNILQFNATRTFTGQFTCHAYNTMESSNGTKTIGHGSSTYDFDILYPPALEALSMSKVIEREDFIKTCRTSSGKTTTQTVTWMWDNATAGVNSPNLIFPKVTMNKTAKYMCKVIYAIVPTYGENRTGHINTSF